MDKTREKLPEVGGIIHLEHFNFVHDDQELATAFFVGGMGFTRDPYQRTDETNMGINVGRQQFHLPTRGATPPFVGEIGLVVPDIPAVKARLERLESIGRLEGTPYAWQDEDGRITVTSPFGVRLRLHAWGSIPFLRPLGIAHVDFPVPIGAAEGIAAFYREIMAAPAELAAIDGADGARVTMGAYQYVHFIERDLADYDYYNFHIAYYASNYNRIRDVMVEHGALVGDGLGQVFFCNEIFHPDNGELLLTLNNEIRSVYHPDFMRAFVNRWNLDDNPFTTQADVRASLTDVLGPPENDPV